MRKLLIFLILLLMFVLGYVFVFKGTTTLFTIYNLDEISNNQKKVDDKIAQVKSLQDTTLKSKQDKLKKSMKEYDEAKEIYEDLLVSATEEEREEAALGEFYDIEFLWAELGTYSTKLGVDVTMTISKAGTATTGEDSQSYQLCNFDFKVTGTYINVTDYIYAIEDDSDLGFGINSFKLLPDGDKLTATFALEQIPVSTATLSTLSSSSGVNMDDEVKDSDSDKNTTSNSTNNTTNTNSNTNSNSNSNSTNTTNTTNSTNTTD